MSSIAIRVDNLGKRYKLGVRRHHRNIRETISAALSRGSHHAAVKPVETFWALHDLSFEVKRGEVLGVIGSNGAGKSTLLKILSRVTEPTAGCVDIWGKVGSLLEVGTGFHPELTGRENVFLNGAILGMSKARILEKFDEIVGFAEVGEFLDTPVKRYSSGMYMRLAFAVAAHLEPDVLIVDEVLAVGDAAFQKKCLGKLQKVAEGHNRTVLFVSHNMQAVQSLCTSVLHLSHGRIVNCGDPRRVIAGYLADISSSESYRAWDTDAPGNRELQLKTIEATADGDCSGTYSSSSDILVRMTFELSVVHTGLCVGFDIVTGDGVKVLRSYQTDMREGQWPHPVIGTNSWVCRIPAGLLNGGQYYVCPKISIHNVQWIVDGDAAIRFQVVLNHGVSPFWNSLNENSRSGVIAPLLDWWSAQ
jgi:lipopolysaccharide transport system ATP-binding protein